MGAAATQGAGSQTGTNLGLSVFPKDPTTDQEGADFEPTTRLPTEPYSPRERMKKTKTKKALSDSLMRRRGTCERE